MRSMMLAVLWMPLALFPACAPRKQLSGLADRLRSQGFEPARGFVAAARDTGAGSAARLFVHPDISERLLVYAGPPERAVVANEVIVKTVDTAGARLVAEALGTQRLDGEVITVRRIPHASLLLVRSAAKSVLSPSMMASRLRLPAAAGARFFPNVVYEMEANQDLLDPRFPDLLEQWAIRNDGTARQGSSVWPTTFDADADGAEALVRMQELPAGSVRQTIVGVLDTGIDPAHPALAPVLWTNPGEVPGNGKDDDANGYVDDIHGWNFGDDNSSLTDFHGHGTHVAGIVAARPPAPGMGSRGISPYSRILVGRLNLKTAPLTTTFAAAAAIEYAIANGADVINMSFGSDTPDQVMLETIHQGVDKDTTIFVAAAGNDGRDLGMQPVYPCSYGGLTCVANTTFHDSLARNSNYNALTVQIGAPGSSIYSTLPGSTYGTLSGTSMASPLVAGVFAAMKSLRPGESNDVRRQRLYGTADRVDTLVPYVAEGRRLNAYHALFDSLLTDGTIYWNSPYCSQRIPTPEGGVVERHRNFPYANWGESGVDGSAGHEFTICTAHQLEGIRDEDLNKRFFLAQHIYWRDADYPIGGSPRPPGQPPLPFNGLLDGRGYSIVGMKMRGKNEAGLIARLGPGGAVKNLVMRRVDISVTGRGGAISPESRGVIMNVEVDGRVRGGESVGGLVGDAVQGTIDRVYFEGAVEGRTRIGGIAGSLGGRANPPVARSSITQAHARVVLEGRVAGGIVGQVYGSPQHTGAIAHAHAFVRAHGNDRIGGIAGALACGSAIQFASSEGRIEADGVAGGLVGELLDAEIAIAYSSMTISPGSSDRGGAVGKVTDGLLRIIDGVETYVCTGTKTPPKPSSTIDLFYNSSLAVAAARGTPRTSSELRIVGPGGIPQAWFKYSDWHHTPGFMPVLNMLPRSVSRP